MKQIYPNNLWLPFIELVNSSLNVSLEVLPLGAQVLHWNVKWRLHCSQLNCTGIHCSALLCSALHSAALHCTTMHCTALHCIALH